ncbi:MAG: TGS domain-containing protein [Chloroflexota bacterium]
MPANLPPQYYAAEKAFRDARTTAEKIEALETMLAVMPKHKGTDHLKADLRAKIAKLTEQEERQTGGARAQLYHVRKEGAGQAALIGVANAGKSRLLGALTDASPKVADYPYTTQFPMPAMMPFENIQVQIVDLPPVTEHPSQGWMRSLIRQADLLLLVVDLSFDPLAEMETVLGELGSMRIEPVGQGEVGATGEMTVRKRALVVGNKLDAADAPDNLELLEEVYRDRFPIVSVSGNTGRGLEELKRMAFQALGIVRVYSRAPGQPVDMSRPIIVPRGSTVVEVAEDIHKDLARNLKYALVWGSGKFSGQRVSRQYVPEDGDIVELCTK